MVVRTVEDRVDFDTFVDDGSCSLPSCVDHGGIVSMVEFYAPWCPHCQHFGVTWSSISDQYQQHGVQFGAIDCTQNRALCARFKVTGLPTMCAFVSQLNGTVRPLNACDSRRSGELDSSTLRKWVDQLLQTAGRTPPPHHQPSNISHPELSKTLVPQTNVDTADLAATLYWGLNHGAVEPGTRLVQPGSQRAVAMASWLQLIQHSLAPAASDDVDHLIAQLVQPAQEPLSELQWAQAVNQTSFWGHDSRVDFVACTGPNHGYACGLWQIFHSLAAVSTDTTAAPTLLGIREYVEQIFDCEPCQHHFLNASAHLTQPSFEISSSLAMQWLWETHNDVSVRVSSRWSVSASQAQYPSVASCPTCRADDGSWDTIHVEGFLRRTYSLNNSDESDSGSGLWSILVLFVLVGVSLCGVLIHRRSRRHQEHIAVPLEDSSWNYKPGSINAEDVDALWDSFPEITMLK